MRRVLWLAACLAGSTPGAVLAAAAGGTVSLDGQTMKVVDAWAYERKAEFGDEMAVRVRLSEKPLDRKALEAVIDFAFELNRQRGEDGRYVEMELSKEGAYYGDYSYVGGRRQLSRMMRREHVRNTCC